MQAVLGPSRCLLQLIHRLDRVSNAVWLTLTDGAEETCTICFEDVTRFDVHAVKECQHRFCIACLHAHCRVKLQERRFPTSCPQPGCTACLSYTECCLALSTKEEKELLNKVAAEAAILAKDKFYCPNPICSSLMLKKGQETGRKSRCPACDELVCMQCCSLWHHGQTCGEAKASKTDDSHLLQLAQSQSWRQCHQCRNMIERTQGCNHMKCRCGAEFCYDCGAAWSHGGHACGCGLYTARPQLPLDDVAVRAIHRRSANPYVRDHPSVYRTRLCRFHSAGWCRYGTQCTFAHGLNELRR